VSERLLTARERLAGLLAPEVLASLDDLIAEHVAALAPAEGNGSPWLSLADGAEYLSVSERTLERAISRGRLRTSTIGRRRLVHRDDLDAYARAAGEE
jgi:excisionase family DNA binding protein